MVLFGDIAGDDADDGGARHLGGGAHRQLAQRRRLHRRSAPRRARSSGSTASAPPPSAAHTNAFKINEDVVIPLPRMAEYTDGIERINIELSLQNKIALADALEAFLARGNLPLGKRDDANDIPAAELLEDRVGAGAWRWCSEVRALWPGWLDQASRRCSRNCRTTRCAPAGRRSCARRWQQIFTGAEFAPILAECNAIHQQRAQGPRLGRAAHARRRRQRAHQHPGQQRQLRDAADRACGGGAHHGAGAQPRRRDLGRARHRHHQARVPERRRTAALHRLQAEGRPRRPLQQGQAAARQRHAGPTARRCMPT